MQNSPQESLPPFRSNSSKPMRFLNLILGSFWVCLTLFLLAGFIFLLTSSLNETGLDEAGTIVMSLVFSIILLGIAILLIYSKNKMFTTTIIDEKGIHYFNKFNGRIVKKIPWNSFAKREKLKHYFEPPKYDVTSIRPSKSFYDQFYWPVMIDGKVIAHNDAFLGRHFFVMLYANRAELIRTFLLGIKHYRPDITIDPIIYTDHYINPKTFTIDKKQRLKVEIIGGLLCILIFALLCYFIVE